MKKLIPLLVLALSAACSSPQKAGAPAESELHACRSASSKERPKQLWTLGGFSAPESVIYDAQSKALYVSNVVGQPNQKDGKGWISQVSLNGTMVKVKWATGADKKDPTSALNAPKGLRIRAHHLWVADIDRMVAFDLRNAKKTNNVEVHGSKFLNDVAFNEHGPEIFVSDTMTGKIYEIAKFPQNGVLVEGVATENPNGLIPNGDKLLIAGWGTEIKDDFSTKAPGHVLEYDFATHKITPWTKAPMGHLDGLELDGPDAVLVSDWMAGKVFYLKRNGECITLLDGMKNSADIGFIAQKRMLLVPEMGADRLTAYKLPTY